MITFNEIIQFEGSSEVVVTCSHVVFISIHVALYILHIFIIHVSYYRGIFLPLGRLMSNIKTLFYVDKVEIIKATNREYQQTFYIMQIILF